MAMITCLHLAQLLLAETDGLPGLARATTHELRQVKGYRRGEGCPDQGSSGVRDGELSSLRFGRKTHHPLTGRSCQSADAGNVEPGTRAYSSHPPGYPQPCLSMPTIYIGSLNHSVITCRGVVSSEYSSKCCFRHCSP